MSKENFYVVLGLSTDPIEDDFTKIEAIIDKKKHEWSAEQGNPNKALRASALLELSVEMKSMLKDPDFRKREALEARTLLEQQKKLELTNLDAAIKLISLKGYYTDEELAKLVKLNSSIDRETIQKRIKVPCREVKKVTPKPPPMDRSIAGQISKTLESLGYKSLYDFLGLSPTSSSEVLLQAAKSKEAENRKQAKKTAIVTAIGQLTGHCLNIFKSETIRQGYDAALVLEGLKPLDDDLNIAGIDKTIQVVEYDHIIKKAMKLGLSREEAAAYVKDFAAKNKWAVEYTTELSVDKLRQCGVCYSFNEAQHNNCSDCGQPLMLECPMCKSNSSSIHRTCGGCGFSLGDMPNARELIIRAKKDLASNRHAFAMDNLQQALLFWPGHTEASSLVLSLQKHQQEVASIAQEMNKAIHQRCFYAAREHFLRLRRVDESHVDLVKIKEIEEHIVAAEHWVKFAKVRTGDEALDGYLRALTEVEDCEEARVGLEKSPPDPPSLLKAALYPGIISLEWQASGSRGTKYRVLRNYVHQPANPRDGEILTETSQTIFDDSCVIAGRACYYAVFSLRQTTASQQAAVIGPLMRLAELEDLQNTPGDGTLFFCWKVPENASEVAVWRAQGKAPLRESEGTRLSGVQRESFTDTDLKNGMVYGYLFKVAFNDATGKQIYSNGITQTATPFAPPKPIEDIYINQAGPTLEIRWTPAPTGIVSLYLASRAPLGKSGDPLSRQQLEQMGKPIPVKSNNFTTLILNAQGEYWIIPVTLLGETATLGKAIRFMSMENVADLKYQVTGDHVYLDWRWPKGALNVLVMWRHDCYPSNPNETASKQVISKEYYERLGGFCLKNVEKKIHYISIYTMLETDVGVLYSNGCHLKIVLGEVTQLFYEIKLKRAIFRGVKSAELILASPAIDTILPETALVAMNGRQPLNLNDGNIIMKLPKVKLMAGKSIFPIPNQFLKPNSYAKLFLLDNQNAQLYRLMAPSSDKLQLG